MLYCVALDPANADVPRDAQTARNLLNVSKQGWEAYRALPFSGPGEASRAAEVNMKFKALFVDGLEPVFSAIATHDAAQIAKAYQRIPVSQFTALHAGMGLLAELQVTAARATFDAALARFHWFVGAALAGMLIALGAAALA